MSLLTVLSGSACLVIGVRVKPVPPWSMGASRERGAPCAVVLSEFLAIVVRWLRSGGERRGSSGVTEVCRRTVRWGERVPRGRAGDCGVTATR